jgi:hypothetical protein
MQSTTQRSPLAQTARSATSEIPAVDVPPLDRVLREGFRLAHQNSRDGSIAFDDSVGEVSGTWVLGRKPMTEVGLLILHYGGQCCGHLRDAHGHGGKILQPVGADAPEITARFSDPAGNVLASIRSPAVQCLPEINHVLSRAFRSSYH